MRVGISQSQLYRGHGRGSRTAADVDAAKEDWNDAFPGQLLTLTAVHAAKAARSVSIGNIDLRG